jgi:cobyrinic acid a,c-diamide synthase
MPRFLIAAAHKSSGKTIVSTGLAAALTGLGQNLQTFKKGPDYIDPMWLSAASGKPCYNLDFNTMDRGELAQLFASRLERNALGLVETNKGLFDGVALDGSDSNAALAKLLNIPVVLVVDTSGMTRGIAPLLQGYSAFDAEVNIKGVILNKTGGSRHEGKLRAAVETYTDLPVIGAIGRNPALEIGERHLGLTTPAETGELARTIATFGRIVGESVDLEQLLGIARSAPDLAVVPHPRSAPKEKLVRIAIARDTAFGFYYPDDLEAFAKAGAELVPFDTLNDAALPEVDGLFIGGGFPETQMAALSANRPMLDSIARAIRTRMPAYAECGGLMYLCQSLSWNGQKYPMAGVVPGDAVMYERPQGRGYTRLQRLSDHPWGGERVEIKAHEFHYARVENLPESTRFAREMTRGAGIGGQRDGIVIHNLLAGFCHLRNSRATPWVREFVDFVRRNKL